jgi:Late exocytosis, associated with Golgi transport
MTTLREVGFTLAGGSSVLVISWILFGWAVLVRSPLIAPRAIARPGAVICGNIPGNAWFGWIPWTLRLTYDTLLEGIPGTGTRENGKSGSLLKVNLDGIVLLRFHAVCLRVSLLAAVIFVVVLVPTYLSAQCFDLSDCDAAYNLTDYQRTTLANIPNVVVGDPTGSLNKSAWRLYAVVIAFWIVASYLCHELQQEWAQILAMRRVYYLEYDIWGERRSELRQTMLDENTYQLEPHLTDRDPWVPHPEQRDTVPNIALYSILVGGLPSLPEQAADSFNAEATIQFSKRESIDWQLSLTTTFFDHCVPNQPGFSSSVAAVTIIPSAMDLSVAWRKWYAAASKLRRLRFIRQQIAKKLHYEIDDVNGHDDDDDDDEEYGYGTQGIKKVERRVRKHSGGKNDPTDYGYDDDDDDLLGYGYEPHEPADRNNNGTATTSRSVAFATDDDVGLNNNNRKGSGDEHHGGKQMSPWCPADDDVSDNFNIYASSDFGPEQAAVYAREFAQSAAPCCPVGCNEGRLRRAGIDQLRELERLTAVEVHQANLELRAARRRATRADTNHHYAEFEPPKAEMINAHSCIQLGDLESGEGTGPTRAPSARPMASRYDRKASMGNTEQAVKEDREKRLNQLNHMSNVVSGDLGLEAHLFKKNNDTVAAAVRPPVARGAGGVSTRHSFASTTDNVLAVAKKEYLNSSQKEFLVNGLIGEPAETEATPKKKSKSPPPRNKVHNRTPSTEGAVLPCDIALEAQLLSESSQNSSSGGVNSYHRLPHISENKDSTAMSDSVSKGTTAPVTESAPLYPLNTDFDDATSAHWAQVESIVTETKVIHSMSTPSIMANGAWAFDGLRGFFQLTKRKGKGIQKWAQQQSKEAVSTLARESTYAVLTFTSRQAAVAARSCLADGRGAGRWATLKDIPIPPLSDAAPGDLVTFRNCCRPVTLSINERQKSVRNYL